MVEPTTVSDSSAAGGLAYTVSTAVPASSTASSSASTTTSAVATPAIIGFGFAPGDCPNIRFRGFVEGVAYRVVRSTSVDFKPENCEFPDGEIVSVKGDEAIWEGSKPDDPATGAKFYRVEVVRTAAE